MVSIFWFPHKAPSQRTMAAKPTPMIGDFFKGRGEHSTIELKAFLTQPSIGRWEKTAEPAFPDEQIDKSAVLGPVSQVDVLDDQVAVQVPHPAHTDTLVWISVWTKYRRKNAVVLAKPFSQQDGSQPNHHEERDSGGHGYAHYSAWASPSSGDMDVGTAWGSGHNEMWDPSGNESSLPVESETYPAAPEEAPSSLPTSANAVADRQESAASGLQPAGAASEGSQPKVTFQDDGSCSDTELDSVTGSQPTELLRAGGRNGSDEAKDEDFELID